MRPTLIPVTFLYVSAVSSPAHAYLDPGTGSILVQLLLGGVAGVAALLKLYWRRIRVLFSRERPDEAAAVDDSPR